jgi:carbon-monoxide dehydrogenase large subunit
MAGTAERPIGFGRLQRKEDPRFIRGRGNYVDDVSLPGMLHGAILRSPLAHAKLVSIDTSRALAHPKVRAVITGKDLEGLNLAWMPTLSADVEAVLVTDKVRFQHQEVAFVVADDHYSARDALELIDVEYEPLPAMVDASAALDPDAPSVRDEIEGRTDNRIFDWEAGDRRRDRRGLRRRRGRRRPRTSSTRARTRPRWRRAGRSRTSTRSTGKLTLWTTSQAPHAHRTLYAIVAGLPEHKIRVISPDIGGGFGNKVPIYPGYVCSVVGSIVTGKPVKWVEDRSENLMSTGSPATTT